MKLSDFDFDLPEALIATRPAVPRMQVSIAHSRAPLPSRIAHGHLPLRDWPGNRNLAAGKGA